MTGLVALADLKGHLNLDPSATDQDGYLTALCVAATRACETRIGRPLLDRPEVLTLDRFPGGGCRTGDRRQTTILIPGPVTAVTEVGYRDVDGISQTLDPSSYVADLSRDPARLGPIGAWPSTALTPGAVTIAYEHDGLSIDDQAMAAHAIRLLVGSWFAHREAIATERFTPDELPLSVTWLLEPLRSQPVIQP